MGQAPLISQRGIPAGGKHAVRTTLHMGQGPLLTNKQKQSVRSDTAIHKLYISLSLSLFLSPLRSLT